MKNITQILKLCFFLTACAGAAVTNAEVTYYHTDLLGTPALITDENGNVISRNHSRTFGESIEGVQQDVGYTGHQHDSDLGLTYMQARYYDPVIGRFYSNDPIGFRDLHSFNRYAYASNNPYKYTDPTGMYSGGILPNMAMYELYGVDGATQYVNMINRSQVIGGAIGVGAVGAFGCFSSVVCGAVVGTSINTASESGMIDVPVPVAKGAGKADDFFKGTKYTNKVKGQMKQDDFHSFPESVKGFQDAGKISKLKGGDGVVRDKLEIPGSYRGRDGRFEFIKEPDNTINHRLFRPDRE